MQVCPKCGSIEMDISHPRTFYTCKSSDYDQRPTTFSQSRLCELICAGRQNSINNCLNCGKFDKVSRDCSFGHDRDVECKTTKGYPEWIPVIEEDNPLDELNLAYQLKVHLNSKD